MSTAMETMNKALNTTATVVMYAVAITYVLGQRLGRFYYANQDEIHQGVSTFSAAVSKGTARAILATIELGTATRQFYSQYYPVVSPQVEKLYNALQVGHNSVSDFRRNYLGDLRQLP